MIRIAVIGVTGRMGRAIVRAAAESSGREGRGGSRVRVEQGARARTLVSSRASPPTGVQRDERPQAALAQCDVAIDFSNAGSTAANVAECRARSQAGGHRHDRAS